MVTTKQNGVMIAGMDMPKNCKKCRFLCGGFPKKDICLAGQIWLDFSDSEKDDRPENCPLQIV